MICRRLQVSGLRRTATLLAVAIVLAFLAAAMTPSVSADCGEESAPSYEANEIRDIIDYLPTIPPDMPVSDPFFLLANEVSHREELGLPVTSDDLVKNCSMDFEGIVHNLPYLDYGDNWEQILKAYQERYGNDYPAIRDALNRLKDQAEAEIDVPQPLLEVLEGQAKKTLADLFGQKNNYKRAEIAYKLNRDLQEFANWEPDYKERVSNHLKDVLNDPNSLGYQQIRDVMPIVEPGFNPFIDGRMKTFDELTDEEKELLIKHLATWDGPLQHKYATYKIFDGVVTGFKVITNMFKWLAI